MEYHTSFRQSFSVRHPQGWQIGTFAHPLYESSDHYDRPVIDWKPSDVSHNLSSQFHGRYFMYTTVKHQRTNMARLAKNTENAIGIFFCQTGISRTVFYQLLSACDLKKKKKIVPHLPQVGRWLSNFNKSRTRLSLIRQRWVAGAGWGRLFKHSFWVVVFKITFKQTSWQWVYIYYICNIGGCFCSCSFLLNLQVFSCWWKMKLQILLLTVCLFIVLLTADKAYTDVAKEDHKFSVSRCYLVSFSCMKICMI